MRGCLKLTLFFVSCGHLSQVAIVITLHLEIEHLGVIILGIFKQIVIKQFL